MDASIVFVNIVSLHPHMNSKPNDGLRLKAQKQHVQVDILQHRLFNDAKNRTSGK